MNLFLYMQKIIKDLEDILLDLQSGFPSSHKETFGDIFRYRHLKNDRSDVLASFLKMVRVLSLLNACVVLIKHGFVQEVYILNRSIDEATDDVTFWAMCIGDQKTSKAQIIHLKDFYQEPLTTPGDPLSIPKRQSITRSQIQDLVAGDDSYAEGPKTMKDVSRSIYRIFSGYVHGSYASIMELYGQKFHTRGMLNTPRISECIGNLTNYVYRTILALLLVASRSGRKDLVDRLVEIRDDFSKRTGCA